MKRKPGCLLTIVIVLFIFLACFAWFVHDIPSVDDHGLGATPDVLPAEDNGFLVLLEATNQWVSSPEWVHDWVPGGTNFDEEGASELIGSNDAFFAHMDLVLECSQFQSKIIMTMDDLYMPWIVPLSDWARLTRVKSEWQFRQGKQADAIESALKVIRMGQLIQNGSGTLIEYLIATGLKRKGLDQVMTIGLRLRNPADLMALEKRLRPYQDAVSGYEGSMQGEYRLNRTAIGEMAGGDLEAVRKVYVMATSDPLEWIDHLSAGPQKTGEWIPSAIRRGLVRLVLHPNRANQWAADFDAELIAGRDRPFRDAFGPVMEQAKAWDEKFERGPKRFLLCRNPLGSLMRVETHSIATFETLRGKVSELEARTAAIRLALVLRAYHLEKNGYPERLAQLVPDYLPSLHRDPYDGCNSLRYHAEKQLVYAIGMDLKDDGGDPENDVALKWGGAERP